VLSSTMPLLSITLYLIRHYQAALIWVFPFSESLQAARRLSFCKVRFPPFWLIESLPSFGNNWVLPRFPVSISSISDSVQDPPPTHVFPAHTSYTRAQKYCTHLRFEFSGLRTCRMHSCG
jgi:hypothetical protein